MTAPEDTDKPRLFVSVAIFAVIAWLGMQVFGALVPRAAGLVVVSVVATFLAGAAANAVVVMLFANRRLDDLGLSWKRTTGPVLANGFAAGVGAALLVLGVPLVAGIARLEPEGTAGSRWLGIVAITGLLFLGAMGEEMIFHGYAFQALMRTTGAFATILPVGVLFGLAHLGNRNVSPLGIINTVAWGFLLGYAFWRSQSLWLPIGLHFGWNLTLPLLGASLSGFTMSVTGYSLVWKVGALWSGGSYGPEGSVLTTTAIGALFFLLGWMTRSEVVPAMEGE